MIPSTRANPLNKDSMKRTQDNASVDAASSDTWTGDNDLSILRKPIKTSATGFNEARRAYEDGTQEVKRLLSSECDIIYECKVCRNMFRSLANFISHKRIYCQQQFNASIQFGFGNDGQFSQDLTTIVQAENDYMHVGNGKHQDKDLSSIIERLAKRERTNRMLKLNDFYEQVNKKLTQDEIVQQKHELQLEYDAETQAAVYQTVRTTENGSIKAEVNEIDELLRSEKNVLGPDGKILSLSELPYFNNSLLQNFECEICNSKFDTEKTLKLHIQGKHIPSTYVYQCPQCSQTFLKVSMVIRHLTNDHKKSARRIRQMRDAISKRRTRLDEVQVKGPSRELTRLQTDKERDDAQKKAWLDNLENSESGSICTYCGKKFERRAVLISHTKVCQNKNKTNSILVTKAIDHDESSNSNSFDAFLAAEDISKPMTDEQPDVSGANKRKRSRAFKAVINENQIDMEDDKSLNMYWNEDGDSSAGEYRSNGSPFAELEATERVAATAAPITWNIIDPDTRLNVNVGTVEESPIDVKTIKSEPVEDANRSSDRKSSKAVSTCQVCSKTFSNVSNLRRHMQTLHSRVRKFACLFCNKFVASRQSEVVQHAMAAHSCDRISALKMVDAREEHVGGPSAVGSSRRKNKHTDVLSDDAELTIIEPEAAATEEVDESEPVTPMDTSNENSNADIEQENHSNDSTLELQDKSANQSVDDDESAATAVKRKGRPKGSFKAVVRKPEKTETVSEVNITQTRRPVRNRIMPIKRDFVYDLATLLKGKDVMPREREQHSTPITTPCSSPPPTPASSQATTKAAKHRHSLPAVDYARIQPEADVKQPEKPTVTVEPIKGAAHVMAMAVVAKSLAAFYKSPDLPTERSTPIKSVVKPRDFDSNALKDWPAVKKPNQIIGNRKLNGGKMSIASARVSNSIQCKRLKRLSSQPTLPSHRLKSSENILMKLNGKNASNIELSPHKEKYKGWSPNDIAGTKSESSEVSGSDTDMRDTKTQASAPARKTVVERLAEIKRTRKSCGDMSL